MAFRGATGTWEDQTTRRGSGGFLVGAYHQLRKLNGIPQRVEGPLTESFHQQLLNQLYGVDINQFPAHLSVINLAIQNPKTRIQKIHVLPKDFFDLKPGQAVLTGFAGLTAEGGRTSVILPPAFEAVVANPPFIRQEYVGARASTLDDAAESSSSNALAL